MSEMSRRDLMAGVAAVAAFGGVSAAEPVVMKEAKAFPVEAMAVTKLANGQERRQVLEGALVTGEYVSLHTSVSPAGMTGVKAHLIKHSEIICVQEGVLEFEHDGKFERVGAGGVIYVAYGTNHAVRNVGDGVAKYFVLGIGGDVKK